MKRELRGPRPVRCGTWWELSDCHKGFGSGQVQRGGVNPAAFRPFGPALGNPPASGQGWGWGGGSAPRPWEGGEREEPPAGTFRSPWFGAEPPEELNWLVATLIRLVK